MAGKDNLKPLTTEKAREIGKKGGKASVAKRREKKLMSQIWAEYLEKKCHVTGKTFHDVADKIIQKGGPDAIRMFREVREATEGNKLTVDANITVDIEEKKKELKDRLTRLATDRTPTT